jgi:4-amino-4-deoxy-L-arabinose transferase-like glycosyltransferase
VWYLLRKIIKKELLFSEFFIITWFVSFFIIISLNVESFTQTKYYVPMILPIVLIMAYGFVNCLNRIFNKVIQKIFFITTLVAHAVTYLIFWENIYFNPAKIWRFPLDMNFQKAILDPIVLSCSIIFLISFIIIICMKIKSRQIIR